MIAMKTHNEVDLCLTLERACRLAVKARDGEPLTQDERIQAGFLAERLKEIGTERAQVLGIDAKYPDLG